MFSLLHIDNNFFYKEILKQLSDEKELRYFSAKTPTMAYDILNKFDIDIIITGLEFEVANRESFISELIKVKHNSTPIIVFTSDENPTLMEDMYKLGITKYLTKDRFMDYLTEYIQKLQLEDFTASQLKTLKIAILDDNLTHMEVVKDLLNRNGITHVTTFSKPFDLLNSHEVHDIYLIDLVLPEMSGSEVIEKLRNRDEYAVIIAVSSMESHNIISKVLTAGADDYIIKPITPDLFLARVKANVRTYNCMQKLKEKNNQLSHLVKVDGLTGLYNHNAIMDILQIEIERAERYQTPLSIIMFDIDKFKMVNDDYGHHIGDEVLQEVGKSLHHISRDYDIPGRYGGEEFVVILPETDIIGAIKYAERFRQDIENMDFCDSNLKITISGGVASFDGESKIDLIKNADRTMYMAKANGRNRIEVFKKLN